MLKVLIQKSALSEERMSAAMAIFKEAGGELQPSHKAALGKILAEEVQENILMSKDLEEAQKLMEDILHMLEGKE